MRKIIGVAVVMAGAVGCSSAPKTPSDNRDPDILVSALSGPTSEDGDQATFQVVLRSPPKADVVLALASTDVGEGTVFPDEIVFNRINWNAPQTVTVSGVDDPNADGHATYQVTVGPAQSSDGRYHEMTEDPVPLTNLDDETASIVVGAVSGPTAEWGDISTVSVRLTAEPTGDVTIPVSTDEPLEALADVGFLLFSPLNWSTAQLITVTGQDDDVADGPREVTLQFAAATSTDTAYEGLVGAPRTFTNFDDETAGVTTAVTDAASSEAGGTGAFTVRLNCQPAAAVTVMFDVDDATEATLDLTQIVFDDTNWDTPVTVTATGLDDDLADGGQLYHVVFDALDSNDPGYDAMTVDDLDLTNSDNETANMVVSHLIGVTTETGDDLTFTVVLTAKPTQMVTIPILSTDESEGSVSVASLVFDDMNWNVPQSVTVTGVSDSHRDGDIKYKITVGPSTSADPVYVGLEQTVKMLNIDDGPDPTLLVFDDAGGSYASLAAAFYPFNVVTTTTTSAFDLALGGGAFDVVLVEAAQTALAPSTESLLLDVVANGGRVIMGHSDLGSAPALQNALGVTATGPAANWRNVFRNPDAVDADLYRYDQQLATVITGTNVAPTHGFDLVLTSSGVMAARFNNAITGTGAVAVTNDGRTVVIGFIADDAGAVDVDGDLIPDIQELYQNAISFVFEPPTESPRHDSTDTPLAIVDVSFVDSFITVPGNATIANVRVSLHLLHTFVSDLDISLISPDGTTVDVTSDNGSSSDDFGTSCADDDRTSFSDDASVVIPASTTGSPFVGEWLPDQPFSTLTGHPAGGEWALRVADDAGGDVGTLECWSLFLEN